jgi:hypothetical protein
MILVTLNYNNQCSSSVLCGMFETMHEADICKLRTCGERWETFAYTENNFEEGYFFNTYICVDDYFQNFMEEHKNEMGETGWIILHNSKESEKDKYKSKKEAEEHLRTLIKL